MALLENFDPGVRDNARLLLEWLGALTPSIDGTEAICTHNLAQVLAEVRHLLNPARQIAREASIEIPILDIAETAIDDLETEINRWPDGSALYRDTHPRRGKKLMQGYMGDYPLYCLLPYVPPHAEHINRYRVYKASLLIMAWDLRIYSKDFARNYSSAIRSAANGLRLAANRPMLDYLPDVLQVGLQETHERLLARRDETDLIANSSEAEYVRALETLFRFFLQRTGGHSRQAGSREIGSGTDSTEHQPGRRVTIARPITTATQQGRNPRQSGLSPAEFAGEVEYITEESDESDPTEPPRTLARQAMARLRRLEAIERNAQLLPVSNHRLAPWEQAVFLRVLKESISGGGALPAVRIEAAAALAISFWTSRKLGDSIRLRIYRNCSDLPTTLSKNFLGFVQSTGDWIIPTLRPKGDPQHSDFVAGAAVPTSDSLHLPDISGAVAYMERLPAWERARRIGRAPAFDSADADIEQECESIMAMARRLSHERITPARIADSVFLAVLDRCQDLALACLTLARPHRLGDTQLHYTEAPAAVLRRHYAESCRSVCRNAMDELREFDKNPVPPPRMDEAEIIVDGSIGCRIRPSDASMVGVARDLASAVDDARFALVETRSIVAFSNLYTAYTIFQLLHLTGLRAVRNLIPTQAHIDFVNRLLIASDKDDYTSFNTRLVPLPDVVVLQLKYYLAHRRTITSRLALLEKEVATALRKEGSKSGIFFLLDADADTIRPLEATPSVIHDLVRQHSPWFDLPENCQRSRLRSRLLAQDCPPQWINAFLGHWTRGEEPWHRFATTSLRRICDGVRDHLNRIAAADRWRTLRGLG